MSEILKDYYDELRNCENYIFEPAFKEIKGKIVKRNYKILGKNKLKANYLIKVYGPYYPVIKEKGGLIFSYIFELPESKDRLLFERVFEKAFENYEVAKEEFEKLIGDKNE